MPHVFLKHNPDDNTYTQTSLLKSDNIVGSFFYQRQLADSNAKIETLAEF